MALERLSSTPVLVLATRRRTPRFPAGDRVDVEIVSLFVPARLLDISLGGFSVETPRSLAVGAVHSFRFVTDARRAIDLRARVIHSRRKPATDGSEAYISGCEFVHDPSTASDRLIEELLQSATVLAEPERG